MVTKKKKLRGGPIIEVDPQILRWREKRKKLGLYKPARRKYTKAQERAMGILHNAPESSITNDQTTVGTPDWNPFK